MDNLIAQLYLYIIILILFITFSVAHFSEHKKFALCLRLISVGYTIGCGGGEFVTSYLNGGPENCDEM